MMYNVFRDRPVIRALALLLVLAGLAATARGAYIPAKAELAQWLIGRAWAATRSGAGPAVPWPWADFQTVARMTVPRHNETLYVLSDASGRSLAFGPGLVTRAPETMIIAGHQDTHFRFLDHLAVGDPINIEPATGVAMTFRVVERRILVGDALPLDQLGGRNRLILSTCWPFDGIAGARPDRLLIIAE